MPVNLQAPVADQLKAVKGVRLGTAEAGIRKLNRRDITLIELAGGQSRIWRIHTKPLLRGARARVCKTHLSLTSPRALVINTGVANAGTGEQGVANALATCRAVGEALGVAPEAVLPFSTGVILEHLPMDRLVAGLPAAKASLKDDGWFDACHAIMTTDTLPKCASRQVDIDGQIVSFTGMSKGAGMIRPNMATMLGYLATDAKVAQPLLDQLVREAAELSFNSITVDGDTSRPSELASYLIATGQVGEEIIDEASSEFQILRAEVIDVAQWLAQAIVRDGEGATKFMSIVVEGGKDRR